MYLFYFYALISGNRINIYVLKVIKIRLGVCAKYFLLLAFIPIIYYINITSNYYFNSLSPEFGDNNTK